MQLVSAQDDEVDLGLISPCARLWEARYYAWLDGHPTTPAGMPSRQSPKLVDMGHFSSIADLDIASPVTENGQVGNSRTASPKAHGGQSDGAITARPSSSAA